MLWTWTPLLLFRYGNLRAAEAATEKAAAILRSMMRTLGTATCGTAQPPAPHNLSTMFCLAHVARVDITCTPKVNGTLLLFVDIVKASPVRAPPRQVDFRKSRN